MNHGYDKALCLLPFDHRHSWVKSRSASIRRCAEGKFRPPRHAHGRGTDRLLPVAALLALRPGRPAMARPRPLGAFRRSPIGTALEPAALVRREECWSSGRHARRPANVSPGGQPLHGPSRTWLDCGCGNHHRPARSGRGHQRRHGHRPGLARRHLQPPWPRSIRSPGVRAVRRRRHDGRHQRRGGGAGRPLEAVQAVLDLRQQSHQHRRLDGHPGPCGQHAVVGPVREPERRMPRQRVSARRHRERLGRGGVPLGWERHVGQRGTIIGMRSFAISAPGKVAEALFGFDVAQVVAAAKKQLARHAPTA